MSLEKRPFNIKSLMDLIKCAKNIFHDEKIYFLIRMLYFMKTIKPTIYLITIYFKIGIPILGNYINKNTTF